jgi:hypothetical protein
VTVDPTALRVFARGNHREGYRGVVEVRYFATRFPFDCGHRHETTASARDCVRRLIWRLLDEHDVRNLREEPHDA